MEGRGAVYLIVLFTMPTLSISSNFFDEKIPRLGRLFQATGRGVRGGGGQVRGVRVHTYVYSVPTKPG